LYRARKVLDFEKLKGLFYQKLIKKIALDKGIGETIKKENYLLIAKCFISLHPISVPLIKIHFQ